MPSWSARRSMVASDPSDATRWLSVAICWDCAAADCCRSLIWYEPAARVVLMISRLSRPPPRSPTTRRMNDVRDDVRAAAPPATRREMVEGAPPRGRGRRPAGPPPQAACGARLARMPRDRPGGDRTPWDCAPRDSTPLGRPGGDRPRGDGPARGGAATARCRAWLPGTYPARLRRCGPGAESRSGLCIAASAHNCVPLATRPPRFQLAGVPGPRSLLTPSLLTRSLLTRSLLTRSLLTRPP